MGSVQVDDSIQTPPGYADDYITYSKFNKIWGNVFNIFNFSLPATPKNFKFLTGYVLRKVLLRNGPGLSDIFLLRKVLRNAFIFLYPIIFFGVKDIIINILIT